MDIQQKWGHMCEAYAQEQWQRLEEVGREVQELIRQGNIPNVSGHGNARGLDEAMAEAGVEFVMDRFRRVSD
jgi:hypothetical protein